MLIIHPIPAFSDNYIWALGNAGCGMAAVVDPGQAAPVLKYLSQQGLTLAAILITHQHRDHTGGIAELLSAFPGIPVYGPAGEAIAGRTHPLQEGDAVRLPCINGEFKVMDVPGHTAGHIAYFSPGMLFCGDTLFAAGCGRVFDGTLTDLHHSLQRIAALPPDTRIYCAHEYTLDNLGFAKWVEPDSQALQEREKRDGLTRRQGQPTLPSRLDLELETNPFLRTHVREVISMAERQAGRSLPTSAEVFAVLRTWKDREYD